MSVRRALKEGLTLTARLWVAVVSLLVFYAGLGAAATLLLPYEVVGGQVQVPEVKSVGEAITRLLPAGTLYTLSMAGSLFFLGGVLGGSRRLLSGESLTPAGYFEVCRRWFWPMARWGVVLFVVLGALSLGVAVLAGVVGVLAGGEGFGVVLVRSAFSLVLLVGGAFLIYSPVILVEKGCRVRASLGESIQFIRGRFRSGFLFVGGAAGMGLAAFFAYSPALPGPISFLLGTACLVAGMVLLSRWNGPLGAALWGMLIVALLWQVDVLLLAPAVRQLQAALGIPPFTPGFPVFFFSLILGLPQALIPVFLPAALTAYHHGTSAS